MVCQLKLTEAKWGTAKQSPGYKLGGLRVWGILRMSQRLVELDQISRENKFFNLWAQGLFYQHDKYLCGETKHSEGKVVSAG